MKGGTVKTKAEPDRWLNTKEAAEYLGVGVPVMRRLIKKIPGAGRMSRNGRWRVKVSSIDAYLKVQRHD